MCEHNIFTVLNLFKVNKKLNMNYKLFLKVTYAKLMKYIVTIQKYIFLNSLLEVPYF